ncbi:MAG: Transposase domain protein [Variovorax sp.]|nr:Transposase domain protein [Variovorax sp.]
MGNPTGFHLTPGQAHDLEGADVLLQSTLGEAVIADRAYDAQARVIEPLKKAGKVVVIPPTRARYERHEYDRLPGVNYLERSASTILSGAIGV